jgi:hypothetical protein
MAQSIELSEGSEIYVYNATTIRNLIRNKNNVIHELLKKEPNCSAVGTRDKLSSLFYIYKSVLSEEKIDKLAEEQKRMLLMVYCDSTGKVLEVDFRLFELDVPDDFTIMEIEQLEKAFKNHTINLNQQCPGVRYFRFGFLCIFEDLVKQED